MFVSVAEMVKYNIQYFNTSLCIFKKKTKKQLILTYLASKNDASVKLAYSEMHQQCSTLKPVAQSRASVAVVDTAGPNKR